MKTRIIQTRFWDDDVVQSVGKDANHLWIFLLTNKELGMTNYVRIPDAFIQVYTKLTAGEIIKAKKELEDTKKIFFFKDWIFIPNLEKQNNYKNSPSNSVPYEKEMSIVPDDVKSYFDKVLGGVDATVDTTVDGTVDSTHNTEIRNKKPEIRNKKSDFSFFIEKFNSITGSSFKDRDEKAKRQLKARIDEGWTVDQILMAVFGASKDAFLTGNNEGNRKYLTPEYITRSDKLDKWFQVGKELVEKEKRRKENEKRMQQSYRIEEEPKKKLSPERREELRKKMQNILRKTSMP